jgi:hypothetical protein
LKSLNIKVGSTNTQVNLLKVRYTAVVALAYGSGIHTDHVGLITRSYSISRTILFIIWREVAIMPFSHDDLVTNRDSEFHQELNAVIFNVDSQLEKGYVGQLQFTARLPLHVTPSVVSAVVEAYKKVGWTTVDYLPEGSLLISMYSRSETGF